VYPRRPSLPPRPRPIPPHPTTPGCICCTLRADFVAQLAEMAAAAPRFDALIVEASGISEPQQVAEAFDLPTEAPEDGAPAAAADDTGKDGDDGGGATAEDAAAAAAAAALAAAAAALRAHARLDCTVSVVDALAFPALVGGSGDTLAGLGVAAGPADGRSLAGLLTEQVEFADVLVLNKADLVPRAGDRARLAALLAALNPGARVLEATRARVPVEALLGCGSFDMERARASPGWLRSLAGGALPESEEYGIRHVVFRARRPFHPARLHALLFSGGGGGGGGGAAAPAVVVTAGATVVSPAAFPAGHPLAGVLRSKGGAWLATEWGALHTLVWAQAGRAWTFTPGDPWAALLQALDDAGGELDDAAAGVLAGAKAAAGAAAWDATGGGAGGSGAPLPVGDRLTELVLIGVGLDRAAVLAALDAAVVTDAEWAAYTRAAAAVVGAYVDGVLAGGGGSDKENGDGDDDDDGEEDEEGGGDDDASDGEGGDDAQRAADADALAAICTPAWAGGWDMEIDDGEEEDEEDEGEEDGGNADDASGSEEGKPPQRD
jgi:G3E family GTPase